MAAAKAGPKTARRTNTGRLYTIDGRSYWSVTTIIGKGVPKPAIAGWQAKTIAEYAVANHRQLSAMLAAVRMTKTDAGFAIASDPDAVQAAVDWLKGSPWRESTRKMDLGSAVHAEAEAFVLGTPRTEPPAIVAGYIRSFRQFIDDFKPTFLLTEASVFSPRYSYAGTLDAIVAIGGRTILIDYKTGKGVYPDAALQLAAYANAEHVLLPDGTHESLPAIDGAAVLHLREDGYSFIPADISPPVFAAFRYAIEIMRWAEEISLRVLSQPLTSPEAVAFLYGEPTEAVAS